MTLKAIQLKVERERHRERVSPKIRTLETLVES